MESTVIVVLAYLAPFQNYLVELSFQDLKVAQSVTNLEFGAVALDALASTN